MIDQGKYKTGDKVVLIKAPLNKADRLGKVYTVAFGLDNGAVIQIDKDTAMTVTDESIRPQ